MSEGEKLIPINIEDEMKSAYIDYSMSVIVSRALPDVRDGLKPVHRRVLYGMYDLEFFQIKPIKNPPELWEVLGKSPHGDTSVYDAWFVWLRNGVCYRLVDGQGNLDLLMATALQQCVIQRLECKISEEILADIEKKLLIFN
jgi:DNA gyrase subunit A